MDFKVLAKEGVRGFKTGDIMTIRDIPDEMLERLLKTKAIEKIEVKNKAILSPVNSKKGAESEKDI